MSGSQVSVQKQGKNSSVEAVLQQAIGHHQHGRVREALVLYRQILDAETANAHVHNLAGVAYTQAGDAVKAVEHLRRAAESAPEYADAHRNLGIALRNAGRTDEALAAHERLVALEPDSAQAHNELGITLRRAGKLASAARAYRRALELAPEHPDALVRLGNVLQDQDNTEQACVCYRKAIQLNPAFVQAHRSLGNALQRLGRLKEAITSYRQAVTSGPGYAAAYADLGGALVESGEHAEGVRCMRRALELAPQAPYVHSNLGMALHHLGDTKGAVAAYDESLRLEPGNSHALAYKTIALLDLGDVEALRDLVDHDGLLYAATITTPEGYECLAEFNRALTEFAATHPTLMGKDDRRPGITGELLAEPEGPMTALDGVIREQVGRYLRSLPADSAHPFVKRRAERFRMIGWANVLEGGADTHIHPHAWISGVYYAKALSPDGQSGDGQAGWIEFGRPDPAFETTRESEVRVVRPYDGLMLLFPSFFWHRILPFESGEKRISYAFDVFPEDSPEPARLHSGR